MHASTVDLLVSKARLEPEIAVAFAEAIDMALANAQLVTIPILDARFAAWEAKMDARFAKVDTRFDASEAKMDARFAASEAKVDARITALEAKLDAKLEKVKADLVRWVFLVMLGNVAVSVGATALLNAIQRGH
jgi:hypothetical protein